MNTMKHWLLAGVIASGMLWVPLHEANAQRLHGGGHFGGHGGGHIGGWGGRPGGHVGGWGGRPGGHIGGWGGRPGGHVGGWGGRPGGHVGGWGGRPGGWGGRPGGWGGRPGGRPGGWGGPPPGGWRGPPGGYYVYRDDDWGDHSAGAAVAGLAVGTMLGAAIANSANSAPPRNCSRVFVDGVARYNCDDRYGHYYQDDYYDDYDEQPEDGWQGK